MEVDLFVLDALPQALDEEVVAPGALAVHAELDAVLLDPGDEGRAGELAPLVGVEDPGAAVLADRGLQGVETKIYCHGILQAPGQDPAGRPVQHDDQVEE